MKLKHFANYGFVQATKVKDKTCTLHIKVKGNHEWGLIREDLYDVHKWLVCHFDKTVGDFYNWKRNCPQMAIKVSFEDGEEVADYYFWYYKEGEDPRKYDFKMLKLYGKEVW